MGYRPEPKIYNLEFADRPGLEVSARSATLGEITYVSALTVNVHEKDEAKRMEVFSFFANKLIKWNIEHPELDGAAIACPACGLLEGAEMPPTVDSMKCLELELIMAIITGWVFAVARVSLPKGMSSNGGGINIPEDMMRKLETLQNPTPLPVPNFS